MFYEVYLVKRFGGTPGKLIVGIKIIKVDGSAIGYREAILRYLPGFIFSLLSSSGLVIARFSISDADFFAVPAMQRTALVATLIPAWCRWGGIADQAWMWGELLVLLTNKKKRALHDYIAGTVVIIKDAWNNT